MIDRELVPHALLVQRFEEAVDVWKDGANAEDLPRYIRNLHSLERDVFLVDESEIELPAWV